MIANLGAGPVANVLSPMVQLTPPRAGRGRVPETAEFGPRLLRILLGGIPVRVQDGVDDLFELLLVLMRRRDQLPTEGRGKGVEVADIALQLAGHGETTTASGVVLHEEEVRAQRHEGCVGTEGSGGDAKGDDDSLGARGVGEHQAEGALADGGAGARDGKLAKRCIRDHLSGDRELLTAILTEDRRGPGGQRGVLTGGASVRRHAADHTRGRVGRQRRDLRRGHANAHRSVKQRRQGRFRTRGLHAEEGDARASAERGNDGYRGASEVCGGAGWTLRQLLDIELDHILG